MKQGFATRQDGVKHLFKLIAIDLFNVEFIFDQVLDCFPVKVSKTKNNSVSFIVQCSKRVNLEVRISKNCDICYFFGIVVVSHKLVHLDQFVTCPRFVNKVNAVSHVCICVLIQFKKRYFLISKLNEFVAIFFIGKLDVSLDAFSVNKDECIIIFPLESVSSAQQTFL
jgi:hypothetical protein